MRRSWLVRHARWWFPSVVLLQITACLGPDPQLFITSSIANAVLVNVITLVFSSLFGNGLAVV